MEGRHIAILGWGSLIWDTPDPGKPNNKTLEEFERWIDKPWLDTGPAIDLEFSRQSAGRGPGALTLVIDSVNGVACGTSYCWSKRQTLDEAIEDLRKREGIPRPSDGRRPSSIGYIAAGQTPNYRDQAAYRVIQGWAAGKNIDAVIWTDLPSNFPGFSVPVALSHLRTLKGPAQRAAFEYIRNAPSAIQTPLRTALQSQPWFTSAKAVAGPQP